MRQDEPGWRVVDATRATVVYADLFGFVLSPDEIHRDLIRIAVTPAEAREAVQEAIENGDLVTDGEYVFLPGRGELTEARCERSSLAARLWPAARRFGVLLASLPFVRMVAVTGSLAADNPTPDADLDFLIVTVPGRLWLVRALSIAVVRLARAVDVQICPNYLLSTHALPLDRDDLFTAHELLQATPIAGDATYRRMLGSNGWARRWLPNRFRQAECQEVAPLPRGAIRRTGELVLAGSIGNRIEGWEARRKRSRLGRANGKARFTADVCEGYFGDHRERVLQAFEARCRELGIIRSDPLPEQPGVRESLHVAT